MRRVGGDGSGAPLLPLITRDPVSGGELVVTRLESPQSGLVIEGAFSLGWIGRLTPEQMAFVGHLVRNRGNVEKVAPISSQRLRAVLYAIFKVGAYLCTVPPLGHKWAKEAQCSRVTAARHPRV